MSDISPSPWMIHWGVCQLDEPIQILHRCVTDFNPWYAKKSLRNYENISVFFNISWHWYGAGSWNHISWKTRTFVSYITNTMVADDLVTHRARASRAIALTYLWNILVSAPEGSVKSFTFWMKVLDRYWRDCLLLTHLPLDKMAAISQTMFSDAFS